MLSCIDKVFDLAKMVCVRIHINHTRRSVVKRCCIVLCFFVSGIIALTSPAEATSVSTRLQECVNPSDVRVLAVMGLGDAFGDAPPAGYRMRVACYDLKNHITQWVCYVDDQHCTITTECPSAAYIKNVYGIDTGTQKPKVFSGKPGNQVFEPDHKPHEGIISLYFLSTRNNAKVKKIFQQMRGQNGYSWQGRGEKP